MAARSGFKAGLVGGLAVSALALVGTSGPAQAIDFTIGEVEFFIDTTISYGVSVRVQNADCSNISVVNGGCPFGPQLPDFGLPIAGGGVNALGQPIPEGGLPTITRSLNTDDGTLNFGRGDLVNAVAKVSNEFEVRWRNFSALVRTLAFYDSIYDRNDLDFRNLSGPARDDIGSDFLLFDAVLSGNFDVADMPLTVRIGNQVINWGESLLIQGGINSYVPVEVARLRAPGSEVKEGLLPVPAVYSSLGILPNVEVQGFYQWNFVETEVDPAQSFFSVADFAGDGGSFVLFGGADDPATSPVVQTRFADQGRRDQAYGFGLSYYADWLNQGTELQFYFVNFTSHLPYLTFQAPSMNLEAVCDLIIPDGFDGGPGSCTGDATGTAALTSFLASAGMGQYGFDFPDNIEILGFSFNTELFGSAFAGEFAFFPDLPLQISDAEINALIIDGDTSSIPAGEVLRGPLLGLAYTTSGGASALPAAGAAIAATAGTPYAVGTSTQGLGEIFQAFAQADALTGQLSSVTAFAGSHWMAAGLGADTTTIALNGGFMWVPNMPGLDETVVTAPGCELGHPVLVTSLGLSSGSSAATDLQCASKFSAGYRIVASPKYNNVLNTAWNVAPSVALRKDIIGRSPGPYGPGYVAGQGSVALGLTGELQNRWRAGIEYLNFFGGGQRNRINDRDTVSASVSVSF